MRARRRASGPRRRARGRRPRCRPRRGARARRSGCAPGRTSRCPPRARWTPARRASRRSHGSAGAEAAVRVDRDVAELASEAVGAAEEPPSRTTPPPTPTSPKTQTKSSIPTAAPVQCSASAARFDSFSTWTGRPETRLELVGNGNAVPAEVGRKHDGPGRLLDETGNGHRDPDRAQALTGRGAPAPSEPRARVGRARAPEPRRDCRGTSPARSARPRSGPRARRRRSRHSPRDRRRRRTSVSSRVTPGRPTPRGAVVSPVSRTSSSSTSSLTRLETVPRVSPVPVATSAREHGPAAAMWRRTTAEVRATDRRLVGATDARRGRRRSARPHHDGAGGRRRPQHMILHRVCMEGDQTNRGRGACVNPASRSGLSSPA